MNSFWAFLWALRQRTLVHLEIQGFDLPPVQICRASLLYEFGNQCRSTLFVTTDSPVCFRNIKKRKREGDEFRGLEERGYWGGWELILITLDQNECFQFFTGLLIFAKYLSLYLHIFTCTYRDTHTQAHMYNQHTRGMETTRHRSLVESGGKKALL